jgi:outer membrane receptor protein involved in Fe transport
VKNLIEEVADQLPGPIGGLPEESEGTELTRNFDARFQGVELISRAQPFDWLTLWANYTYLNHDTLDGVLLNRPRHHGSFRARLERSGVLSAGDRCLANVDVYAVGRRDSADPQDEFEPRQLGGYARTDLALAYRLGGRWSQWTITATVHNLFNRDYQESIGFPAPPARFLIGFRYTGLS